MDKTLLRQAAAFCAYQERTISEVRKKLIIWEATPDDTEAIIERLISEKYLNEDRFARSFVGGKFRTRQWGKKKIAQELKQRGVSREAVALSMSEIDDETYEQTLRILIEKKQKSLNEPDAIKRKQKVARYALSKGYEPEKIWKILGNEFD